MQEHESYSLSDLIYLFLDGETDDVQQTVLFGALGSDAELQEEFRQAMQLREAAKTNRPTSMPPEAIGNAVFAAVELGHARAKAGSGSTLVPASFAGAVKNAGLVLVSALSGALLAIMLGNPLWTTPDSTEAGTVAVQAGKLAGTEAMSVVRQPVTARIPQSASVPAAGHAAHSGAAHEESAGHAEGRFAGVEPVYSLPPQAIAANTIRSAKVQMAVIPMDAALRAIRSEQAAAAPQRSRPVELPAFVPVQAGESATRFSLHVGGSIPALWLPATIEEAAGPSLLNDFSAGLFYHSDERQAFGLAGGQMSLALYVRKGSEYELRSQLPWFGAVYQYSMEPMEILAGIQAYGQAGIAASPSGPLFRTVVGLRSSPESRLSFGLGLESSVLLYRDRGLLYGTGRLALDAGMFLRL